MKTEPIIQPLATPDSELRWVRFVAKGLDMQIKCTKASEDEIVRAVSEAAITDRALDVVVEQSPKTRT
jgi:hypothetical protein